MTPRAGESARSRRRRAGRMRVRPGRPANAACGGTAGRVEDAVALADLVRLAPVPGESAAAEDVERLLLDAVVVCRGRPASGRNPDPAGADADRSGGVTEERPGCPKMADAELVALDLVHVGNPHARKLEHRCQIPVANSLGLAPIPFQSIGARSLLQIRWVWLRFRFEASGLAPFPFPKHRCQSGRHTSNLKPPSPPPTCAAAAHRRCRSAGPNPGKSSGPTGSGLFGGNARSRNRRRNGFPGRNPSRLLGPGLTAAPERNSLALLPSGPDAVRRLPVRGTWPSTLRFRAQAPKNPPLGRYSAPLERIAGSGNR